MKYFPTIGIETHVQLKTKTKLFSGVGNDARGAKPNTLISHIDVALPGALPVLNEKALELAVRAAFVLNTRPQKNSYFERKHYFYPDSPMGYQISQLHAPIIIGGSVQINIDGGQKSIGVNRAQLEADAGKNTHPAGADYSLVDLNRAGTPLLEIVSEPEIHSPAEAKAYVRELYLLMKYADISDCDLYLGHMRFDVNVSLSTDSSRLGTRAEIKNLNSFRAVEAAVEYEIKRQTELLDKGEQIIQETRGWDEAKQKTTAQRGKEEAQDYRYMPEPDIPPTELGDEYIAKVEKDLLQLPADIRKILNKLSIEPKVIEDILDRVDLVPLVLEVIEKSSPETARRVTFWLLQNETTPGGLKTDSLLELSEMVSGGELSSTAGKTVFDELIVRGGEPHEIARQLNLLQVSDESAIEKIVGEVIAENPKAAQDIKNGEQKAIGFLVGQVMSKSKGQANPGLAQKIIKKQLESSDE